MDDTEMVSYLIAHHADVNTKHGDSGMTPLMHAVCQNHLSTIASLLECDQIKLEERSQQGETALLIAGRLGNEQAAQKLLMAGADIDAVRERDKKTIFMLAEEQIYNEEILEFFKSWKNIGFRFSLMAQAIPSFLYKFWQIIIEYEIGFKLPDEDELSRIGVFNEPTYGDQAFEILDKFSKAVWPQHAFTEPTYYPCYDRPPSYWRLKITIIDDEKRVAFLDTYNPASQLARDRLRKRLTVIIHLLNCGLREMRQLAAPPIDAADYEFSIKLDDDRFFRKWGDYSNMLVLNKHIKDTSKAQEPKDFDEEFLNKLAEGVHQFLRKLSPCLKPEPLEQSWLDDLRAKEKELRDNQIYQCEQQVENTLFYYFDASSDLNFAKNEGERDKTRYCFPPDIDLRTITKCEIKIEHADRDYVFHCAELVWAFANILVLLGAKNSKFRIIYPNILLSKSYYFVFGNREFIQKLDEKIVQECTVKNPRTIISKYLQELGIFKRADEVPTIMYDIVADYAAENLDAPAAQLPPGSKRKLEYC